MLRNFALMLLLSVYTFSADANNKVEKACGVQLNGFVRKAINIIKESALAESNLLSCDELKKAADLNTNTLAITSGRSRGEYTICLSDDRDNPCKLKLGTFKNTQDPSYMLSQLFNVQVEQDVHLNETVERLFLTPSSLIK